VGGVWGVGGGGGVGGMGFFSRQKKSINPSTYLLFIKILKDHCFVHV